MVRKHRDNLTGEHDAADIGQLLLFIVFMVLWISDVLIGYSNFLNVYVPLVIRLTLGLVLIVISSYFAISGFNVLFGKASVLEGVTRPGVFGIVRHPMYLGELGFYLGLLVINISLAAGGVWITGILFMHSISRYEEKLLILRFGGEYQAYLKDVPMWFPHC